jgi:hypothetical protein
MAAWPVLSTATRAGTAGFFNGMHQMDFAFLRRRPVWDMAVIALCTLGAALTSTGLVLGWKRLRKRR